jgi:hypothetical protein
MNKIKISELPRKEKNAHNMIRIPAWVFGGLWSFGGLISALVLVVMLVVVRKKPLEFGEDLVYFHSVMGIISWPTFLSLGLGVIYLILGFTYRKLVANGKAIVIGIAVLTILASVLLMFSVWDFSAEIYKMAAEDIGDDMEFMFFNRFYDFAMIIGTFISIIYYLIPAILAYIGFHRLEKIQTQQSDR